MHTNGDKSSCKCLYVTFLRFGIHFSNFSGLISVGIFVNNWTSPSSFTFRYQTSLFFRYSSCLIVFMFLFRYIYISDFFTLAANECCFLTLLVSAMHPRCPQGLSMQLPWHGPSLEELPWRRKDFAAISVAKNGLRFRWVYPDDADDVALNTLLAYGHVQFSEIYVMWVYVNICMCGKIVYLCLFKFMNR